MTITRYSSDWNPAMGVLIAYAFIAMVLVLVPVPPEGTIPAIQILPMMQAMQHNSFDPARTIFFWQWMIIAFPGIFLAFSITAPLKLTEKRVYDWYVVPVAVLNFIIFGLFGTPALIWGMFFAHFDANARLHRILISSGGGQWNLFYAGSVLMITLVAISWWSYVAVPVGAFKMMKIRNKNSQRSR